MRETVFISPHRVEALLLLAIDMIEDGAIAGGILAAAVRRLGLDPALGRAAERDTEGSALWHAARDAEESASQDGQYAHLRLVDQRIATLRQAAARIHRQTLSISLFCGALAGALDSTLAALLADPAGHSVALDLAEERGMHEPGYRWPEGPRRGWNKVKPHEHVRLPWESGGDASVARYWLRNTRRCTCGMLEAEAPSARARSGKSAATRSIVSARVRAGQRVLLAQLDGDLVLDLNDPAVADRTRRWLDGNVYPVAHTLGDDYRRR